MPRPLIRSIGSPTRSRSPASATNADWVAISGSPWISKSRTCSTTIRSSTTTPPCARPAATSPLPRASPRHTSSRCSRRVAIPSPPHCASERILPRPRPRASAMLRRLRLLSPWLAVLAGLLSSPVAAQESSRPPNFIVFLADDLGAEELGCYGHAEHQTPNLDRLAREGMRFETGYATPICSPTRVALLTGQYGFRTGWFNLIGSPYSPRPDSAAYDVGARLTFADVLKTRGYTTALTGKWQLSGEPATVIRDCGFDEYRMWAYTHNLPAGVRHTGGFEDKGKTKPARYWHPCIVENGKYLPTQPDNYGPDLCNEFAIDFMRRHRDRPFCLYYTSPLTHSPYLETPDPLHPGRRGPKGFKSNLAYLDHLMGRLVAAVDELGLKERTLILFIGDNGTAGRGKGEMTERGVRVPFIARGPGLVKAGV
ncbi:MAG: hypothetical protein FJ399_07270, partial [Verrucomicrobia bacterium]|nr:hypothetical protein [Verrucomicrobiota bacterium]